MKRLLSTIIAAGLLSAAAASAAAGATYRISSPNVWHQAGDTHVAGFVCRSFNLTAPRLARVHVAFYDASDKLVAAGDAPLQGGTLEAKGISCGHYAAVLPGDTPGNTKLVISALGASGRVLEARAIADAI